MSDNEIGWSYCERGSKDRLLREGLDPGRTSGAGFPFDKSIGFWFHFIRGLVLILHSHLSLILHSHLY